MKVYKVLLVDDDKLICKMISKAFKYEDIYTSSSFNETQALQAVKEQDFDLIILDVNLGDSDGFSVFRNILMLGIDVPVIFLSGKHQDHNKILALGMGADDYITKPFSINVLIAKVKAYLRRGERIKKLQNKSRKIISHPFTLDMDTYQLFKGDKEIPCTSKEILLMKFFMENPNRIFSKKQLYENVWKDNLTDSSCIKVYITNLRKKIEDSPKSPTHLETIWGIGYKFSSIGV